MGDPWWKKITSYVQGNGKKNPLILTISHDPVIEESLGEALGEAMDLVFSDGQHSMESIRQHGKPNLIIGDTKLIVNSPFGRELKDSGWNDVPLLAIAEDARKLNEQELRSLGALDQIKNPYDIAEIKEKVSKFMVTGGAEENIGEPLNTSDAPTQVIAPKIPAKELPKDKNFDTELDTLLAEINKSPGVKEESTITPITGHGKLTDKLEDIEALTESPSVPDYKEFDTFNAKSRISVEPEAEQYPMEFEKQERHEDVLTPGGKEMFDQSLSAESEPQNHEEAPAFSPAPSPTPSFQATVGGFGQSSPVAPGMEAWFRQIIEEKVSQIISQTELSEIVEKIARDALPQIISQTELGEIVEKIAREAVPQIAAERINQEIERIKQKIKED